MAAEKLARRNDGGKVANRAMENLRAATGFGLTSKPCYVPRFFVQPCGCRSAVRSATLIRLRLLEGLATEKWPAALKSPCEQRLILRQCGGLGKHRETLHQRHTQGIAGFKFRGSRQHDLLQRDCHEQRGNDS